MADLSWNALNLVCTQVGTITLHCHGRIGCNFDSKFLECLCFLN